MKITFSFHYTFLRLFAKPLAGGKRQIVRNLNKSQLKNDAVFTRSLLYKITCTYHLSDIFSIFKKINYTFLYFYIPTLSKCIKCVKTFNKKITMTDIFIQMICHLYIHNNN